MCIKAIYQMNSRILNHEIEYKQKTKFIENQIIIRGSAYSLTDKGVHANNRKRSKFKGGETLEKQSVAREPV